MFKRGRTDLSPSPTHGTHKLFGAYFTYTRYKILAQICEETVFEGEEQEKKEYEEEEDEE